MSEADIERLAFEDPDAQPMTDEELAQAKQMGLEEFLSTTIDSQEHRPRP